MNPWWQATEAFLWHPLMRPLAVSAIAGLIAYIASGRAPGIARVVCVIGCLATLVLAYQLFASPRVQLEQTWLEVSGFRVSVAMANRPFGALISLGAALFGLLIAVYACAYERGARHEGRFHAFLCWTLTGAIGAALATNLVWLLLCWELVSLCLYMLLNLGTGDYAAGAAKTFGMIGLGDAAMLLAVALIGATQGTFRLDELSIQVGTPLTYVCYLLFLVAALAKAGAVPLHSWIPAAATNASAATFALLPASLDKLLGIYLLATFSLRVFVLDGAMRTVLMIVGAVTILAAVLMAMVQHRLKKLLAFHAVSQVGYMVLGIGTGVPIGIAGGLFHMVNNAIYKACLFLTAGAVERHAGTDELNRLGGLARALPATFGCCVVAAMAISGMPPLNGFVSKWLVYQGCLGLGSPLALVCLIAAVFGSALTLASFFKVLAAVFLGPAPAAAGERRSDRFLLVAPMVVLAALCVVFGVVAVWPLDRLILPALVDAGVPPPALRVQAGSLAVEKLGLWEAGPATMLAVLGLLGGAALYMIGRVADARVANPFIGGEVLREPAPLKFAATSFYRTVEELPGLRGALQDGARSAFDVYHLGGRYGGTLVEILRRQHTGVLSLYVSWCLVGIVVIIAYLMAVV
jgi:formate hydrogenlyase subunit 3/multisubunit Na+/H+ antiporter MnhD subunit